MCYLLGFAILYIEQGIVNINNSKCIAMYTYRSLHDLNILLPGLDVFFLHLYTMIDNCFVHIRLLQEGDRKGPGREVGEGERGGGGRGWRRGRGRGKEGGGGGGEGGGEGRSCQC